jgi:flagellar M-ring protein FliF
VLDHSFGPGVAVASVDVVLNLDQSKVTTEEILPAKNSDPAASATGVVVREKSSMHEGAGAAPGAGGAKTGGAASNSSEFDYQVGRRVEQVVAASGSIKRMTIAVLVKQAMSEEQLARLKEVVGLSTGVNVQRGDSVVVYSMAGVANPRPGAAADGVADTGVAAIAPQAVVAAAGPASAAGKAVPLPATILGALLLAVLAFCGAAYLLVLRRRPPAPRRLSAAQREQMLADVRRWLATPGDLPERPL